MPAPRKLLAVAAVAPLVLGAAPTAHAAKPKPKPKPVCNLVKDGPGDATGTGTSATAPNDTNADIVSADIASNATTLTAVIRLASLDGSAGSAPAGRAYDVTFVDKGQTILVRGIVGATGAFTSTDGKGTGVVDKAKKEVRISVKLADLSAPVKPNDKLTSITANTWRWVTGTNVALGKIDAATTVTSYVAGWPSCVKVGS